jgi:hypothetical protein
MLILLLSIITRVAVSLMNVFFPYKVTTECKEAATVIVQHWDSLIILLRYFIRINSLFHQLNFNTVNLDTGEFR